MGEGGRKRSRVPPRSGLARLFWQLFPGCLRWFIEPFGSARLWRKEEGEGTPGAHAPVEFVVLAGLGFGPFILAKAGTAEVQLEHRLVGEVFQVLVVAPAELAEGCGNAIGITTAIIVTSEVDDTGIDVDADRLAGGLSGCCGRGPAAVRAWLPA